MAHEVCFGQVSTSFRSAGIPVQLRVFGAQGPTIDPSLGGIPGCAESNVRQTSPLKQSAKQTLGPYWAWSSFGGSGKTAHVHRRAHSSTLCSSWTLNFPHLANSLWIHLTEFRLRHSFSLLRPVQNVHMSVRFSKSERFST